MKTDDPMSVGMTVLRWFHTVQSFLHWNQLHVLLKRCSTRYYFITDPSLFTSSDIIISRILQQTKLIDTTQFVNYHHWSVARRYMSLGSHAVYDSSMTSIIMHILHAIDLSMFSMSYTYNACLAIDLFIDLTNFVDISKTINQQQT